VGGLLGGEHARTQKIRRGLDKVRNIEATKFTQTHKENGVVETAVLNERRQLPPS
jgi:hypothetical protein